MTKTRPRIESFTPSKPVQVVVIHAHDKSAHREEIVAYGAAIEHVEEEYTTAVKNAAKARDGITRIVELRQVLKSEIIEFPPNQ